MNFYDLSSYINVEVILQRTVFVLQECKKEHYIAFSQKYLTPLPLAVKKRSPKDGCFYFSIGFRIDCAGNIEGLYSVLSLNATIM